MAQQSGGTLIELLTRQQDGIKLALHYSLLDRLELHQLPFHHCGATANVALALHLAMRGLSIHTAGQQVLLATFTANGVGGQTPWQKPLVATPSDVARLAGHGRMAAVLDHLEAGVPLRWHPSTQHALPQAARRRLREVARALCGAGWFVRLPGPARQAVMHAAATDVCRELAWGAVQPDEWDRAEKGDFGALSGAVEKLLAERGGGSGAGGALARLEGAASSSSSFSSSSSSMRDLASTSGRGGGGAPAPGGSSLAPSRSQQALSQSDVAARQQEQLLLALVDPLRSFSFRMAFVPHTGADGQGGAGGGGQGQGPERRRGRWWRLLLGSAVPLAAIVVMTSDCRKLKREHLATYLAGTLAGLQLPGVIILVAKLLAGS